MLRLVRTNKSDPAFKAMMAVHYSQPKGFVGRQLLYRVEYAGICYGGIAFGSSTKNLPGRRICGSLNHGVNNTFYHMEKQNGCYPLRNFTAQVLIAAEYRVLDDYANVYGDLVLWFESLVELPRTGEIYRRAGYSEVGQTIGMTCKRMAGASTDSWSGRRVWDEKNLRPKRVFQKMIYPGLV
jgi:hypothetical protein